MLAGDRQRLPRLMAISDRRSFGGALEDWLDGLGGVDAAQLREKDLPDRELFELAVGLRERAMPGTAVLVNGRLDIALASGCAGVHLTSSGLPASALRRRFGDEPIIGCSTHHPREVEAARRAGADYAIFGPVFATPSKASYGPPPGLDGLRRAVTCGLPVLAIGGIGPERMAEVVAAGAAGVAAIRAFSDPRITGRMVEERHRLWAP